MQSVQKMKWQSVIWLYNDFGYIVVSPFSSCSGRDVEWETVSELAPVGTAIDEDSDPGDEDGPPEEAADGWQDHVGLHRLLLREGRPAEGLPEEPDGVDGPEEREEGEPAEEVFPAELNLIFVCHLGAAQIHLVRILQPRSEDLDDDVIFRQIYVRQQQKTFTL